MVYFEAFFFFKFVLSSVTKIEFEGILYMLYEVYLGSQKWLNLQKLNHIVMDSR